MVQKVPREEAEYDSDVAELFFLNNFSGAMQTGCSMGGGVELAPMNHQTTQSFGW